VPKRKSYSGLCWWYFWCFYLVEKKKNDFFWACLC